MKTKLTLLVLFLVLLLVPVQALATSVQDEMYEERQPETIVIPNNSIPESPVEVEIAKIPQSAPKLPATGGIPFWLYAGFGTMMIAAGVILAALRNRKQAS